MPLDPGSIRALTFDVFGTTVDWRGGVAREVTRLGRTRGLALDGERFADAWRAAYAPSMDRVRRGELPWVNLDVLHRQRLDELLPDLGIPGLTEAEKDDLNRAWHRLDPWPDAIPGLLRLKARYLVAPLSNGSFALLTNLSKRAGLPWDCILSAELARRYKRDPEVYRMAAALLALRPAEVMMVAAHEDDLVAARAEGFRTAFVSRPLEHGPHRAVAPPATSDFDAVVAGFGELADRLGCDPSRPSPASAGR
jgi:2-haloacid dehalogenase